MATALIPTNNGDHRLTPEMMECIHDHYDTCSKCNRTLVNGESEFLGKDAAGVMQKTCSSCSDDFTELFFEMQYTPRMYSVPANGAALWRYMDFAKYVSILSTQSLFFTGAKGFEDNFEGALSEANAKQAWVRSYTESRRASLQQLVPSLINEELEKRIKGDVWFEEQGFKLFRKIHCVSCWHENEGESVAMWDLYAKDFANAIAIRTTYRRLYEALGKKSHVSIGRVNYINYRDQFPDINNLFFYKRKSFQHENEVRAVVQDDVAIDTNTEATGVAMPIDVNLLIEKIYISPKAPDRLIKLVQSVNTAFGFPDLAVEKSEIGELPC